MKFSQSFIEEIRNRIRVSEVVGKAIPLRRAGREFHALCPFHKEKSPSFTVNDEKGFFHCFGCGAHGDVIGFTMDYEHLGYREAVEKLAGQAGLRVPRETRAEVEREQKAQSLQQVMETVTSWLEEQFHESREGELARNYLRERGMKEETIAKFRIGYAPADRDALEKAMKAKGITPEQLIECGMLINVEERQPYSRFRRRLMFPIRDRKSRVIAFGGRVLPEEPNKEAPKYLNSPETPLFSKGRQLYNLDIARRAAFDAKQLIICEGYMDVIALAQGGIAYAVAPLGTAITAEQLQLCWQLVDEPTLCLDGDNAGQRAMTRAMELALPLLVPRKTLLFAVMPSGEDPDSFIRSRGRAAFVEKIKEAQPLVAALWTQSHIGEAETPEQGAASEEELMQKIKGIKHQTVQHYYRQHVREKIRQLDTQRYHKQRYDKATKNIASHDSASIRALQMVRPDIKYEKPTSHLIALIIASPTLLDEPGAEDFWFKLPTPAPWQQTMHHWLTTIHLESSWSTSDEIWSELQEVMEEYAIRAMKTAIEGVGVKLSYDEVMRTMRAKTMWPQVRNDVDSALLKIELDEALSIFADDLTEENLERVTSLKGQIEAMNQERSRFYRQDILSGDI